MRKLLIGFMVLLVIAAAAYFRFRRPAGPIEVAYAGNRDVTLYDTTAAVREPVATVNYGDRLDVLRRSQDQVQVRTTTGVVGWIDVTDLLSADVWQRAKELEAKSSGSPIEARGHTHAISNLHIDAGRDSPRIRQLAKTISVDLFERKVVDAPATPAAGQEASNTSSDAETPPAKKEDWWLVRAHLPDQSTVSGWILGRFVDLDVPAPLPDYASAAGMHIVAWFELNHVADPAGPKPQYLLVGSRGPEGQPCDFTLMRAFTWSPQRQRYETAYVESDLCGKLPVNLMPATSAGGDVTFSFSDSSDDESETRTYHMHQTLVRRVKEGGSAPAKRKHAHE